VAEVAKLMVDAGLVVIVSFISPVPGGAALARELFAKGEFVEVFVDAPLEVCEKRDAKGLYAKARAASCRTSPASTARTSRRKTPKCASTPRAWSLRTPSSS
jgi:bifunctional enzyme CysN/CysC